MFRPQPLIRSAPAARSARQKGAALLVVLVFMLLSALLALWAARAARFNEAIVGNSADYQRALQAAQALLQDAELDIRGETAMGTLCVGASDDAKRCRRGVAQQIPRDEGSVGRLLAQLDTDDVTAPPCQAGLCARRTGPVNFWADSAALAAMLVTAARYGEYTGAEHAPGGLSSPLLTWSSDTKDEGAVHARAWYWIEVIPYRVHPHSGLIEGSDHDLLTLHLTPSVVYRVTALARGLKSGTQVVLQEVYAPTRLKD